jgi:hypothetical protein
MCNFDSNTEAIFTIKRKGRAHSPIFWKNMMQSGSFVNKKSYADGQQETFRRYSNSVTLRSETLLSSGIATEVLRTTNDTTKSANTKILDEVGSVRFVSTSKNSKTLNQLQFMQVPLAVYVIFVAKCYSQSCNTMHDPWGGCFAIS